MTSAHRLLAALLALAMRCSMSAGLWVGWYVAGR
jgi:hypothetical protein